MSPILRKPVLAAMILLWAAPLGAAAVPDFTFEFKHGTLTLIPPAKHHFNTRAPNKIEAQGKALPANVQEGKIDLKLGAEGQWKELSRARFGEEVYATPALVDGRIYFRRSKASTRVF